MPFSSYDSVDELGLLCFIPEKELINFLSKFNNLKRLVLPFHSGALLSSNQMNLPSSLEELVIYNTTLDDEIVSKIESLSNLRVLIFDGCSLSIDFDNLDTLFKKLKNLTDIRFFRCSVNLQKKFLEIGHENLQSLHVEMSDISEVSMIQHAGKNNLDVETQKFIERFPSLISITIDSYGYRYLPKHIVLRSLYISEILNSYDLNIKVFRRNIE